MCVWVCEGVRRVDVLAQGAGGGERGGLVRTYLELCLHLVSQNQHLSLAVHSPHPKPVHFNGRRGRGDGSSSGGPCRLCWCGCCRGCWGCCWLCDGSGGRRWRAGGNLGGGSLLLGHYYRHLCCCCCCIGLASPHAANILPLCISFTVPVIIKNAKKGGRVVRHGRQHCTDAAGVKLLALALY